MLSLSNLEPAALGKIEAMLWDGIMEKHEGPFRWADTLKYTPPDFMTVVGRPVLLPVGYDQHPNISILRTILSDDGRSLTVFLKNITYHDGLDEESIFDGYVAVCDQVHAEDFFVAILYHEWYIIRNS